MTLVRLICAGICLSDLLCADARAQGRKRVPRFEDYPVKEIHQGKSAKLSWKRTSSAMLPPTIRRSPTAARASPDITPRCR